MVHVIAILGLAAACMVWYLVQHWARPEGDETCEARDPHCGVCEVHGADCPSPPAISWRNPDPPQAGGARPRD